MPKAKNSNPLSVTPPAALRAVEAAWPREFSDHLEQYASFEAAFEQLGLNDYFDWSEVTSWAALQTLLNDNDFTVEVTAVAGLFLSNVGPLAYAMPTYGWDGGNAISTATINLQTLASTDIFAGPGANLVVREDPAHFGIALHLYDADNTLVIQLF